MSQAAQRVRREAAIRQQAKDLAEVTMQRNFLAGQLRRYEMLVIGSGEAIGKLLVTIDGVLNQYAKKPRGVRDRILRAFLVHLKLVRDGLQAQEVSLGEVAAEPITQPQPAPATVEVAEEPSGAEESPEPAEDAGDPPAEE